MTSKSVADYVKQVRDVYASHNRKLIFNKKIDSLLRLRFELNDEDVAQVKEALIKEEKHNRSETSKINKLSRDIEEKRRVRDAKYTKSRAVHNEKHKFDRKHHEQMIGTEDYAVQDFATNDYVYSRLVPYMQDLACKESSDMVATWTNRGTWTITRKGVGSDKRAFLIVKCDGSWREGPTYDKRLLA